MPVAPLEYPDAMDNLWGRDNKTKIMPYFTSKSVKVLREEEAYPFGSLVADVGGVLGLFIGFNFLMIWDWIVWGIKKMLFDVFLSSM